MKPSGWAAINMWRCKGGRLGHVSDALALPWAAGAIASDWLALDTRGTDWPRLTFPES